MTTTTTSTATTTTPTATVAAPPAPAVASVPNDGSSAVAERLMQIFDDGAVAILLGVGYDTGLLETLAELPPATSEQVADAAGLDERYVREWLGGVVCAEVVEYDPATRTYANTRYLMSAAGMTAARAARGETPGQCTTDPAAITRLVGQQSAVRATLPPLPNEKLVYSCAPAD